MPEPPVDNAGSQNTPSSSAYSPSGFCPYCGYRLSPGRCPECGRDVEQPWRVNPRIYRWRRRLIVVAILAAVGPGAWHFGPGLAARVAPTRLLIWLWDTDVIGSDWARAVLWKRQAAVMAAFGSKSLDLWRSFETKADEFDDHDWAGVYEHEMMFVAAGRYLALTDTEALWFIGEGLQPWAALRGRVVEFDGTHLHLDFSTDRRLLRWGGFPWRRLDSEFVVIHWDEWTYLVAPEELLDFCNDVNGGEPLGQLHLTRPRSDARTANQRRRRPATDSRPTVPAPYARYILRDPTHARVTRCSDGRLPARRSVSEHLKWAQTGGITVYVHTLQLQTDRPADSFVGMRLYAPDRVGLAQVATVQGDTLTATYVEFSPNAARQPLQPGYVLSTLAPPPVPLTPELDVLRYPSSSSDAAVADKSLLSPADIAEHRRWMSLHDWTLLELSRQLRQPR